MIPIPIPETQTLEVLLGQSIRLVIPVTDQGGTPVSVDTATVEFGISPSSTATPTTTLTPTKLGNEITVTLTTADTISLGTGSHFFSCWVTFSGESTPVARGWLKIKASTRG